MMDLLDRLLGHDAWMTDYLIELASGLPDEELDKKFDLGHGTLRGTIQHLVGNIETWTDLMNGGTMRTTAKDDASIAALRSRFNTAVHQFGATARRVRDEQRINDTYMDILDRPPRPKSFGGTILHVLTHNHSHRTEMLHMLERLGVKNLIEGDLLGWEAMQK